MKPSIILNFLETLAEGRSKVRDAKEAAVVVVGAEFLAGVKTEGVASMLKQVHRYWYGGQQRRIPIMQGHMLEKSGGEGKVK